MNRTTMAVLIALMVAGCKVGPNYVPPETTMPSQWSTLGEGGIIENPPDVVQWWTTLNDLMLDELIMRAVAANYDLRLATARVREARAQRGVVAADRWPNIDAAGSYTHQRFSENAGQFGFGTGSFSGEQEADLYQVGFDAAWELDVFGRVARSVEAADADIGAAEESRRDVLITVLAELARNYVDLRGFQQRLAIAQSNIDTQQDTLELTQSRFDAGLTSELDVAQARTQLANSQSQVPALESSIRQTMHAIALLLAQEPASLVEELKPSAAIPAAPADVPVGLPSDLLRRRPDIRTAERDLAAATARIGVATADLFPRFALTGSIGLSAEDVAKLLNGSSMFYSIGPSVVWPVFDAGRIRANIRVQSARQEQALIAYERAVTASLSDVENALVAFWRQQDRRRSLAEAVDASRRAVELSNQLYSRGLIDFLSVLESQRAQFAAEDELSQSEAAVAANLIAIYKALGGGWEAFEPERATAMRPG
jgi:multidrug efflux system outer membrane protein